MFSRRGRTTESSALTRRLVVLIASSSVRNAVCRLASSTSSWIASTYFLRAACDTAHNPPSQTMTVPTPAELIEMSEPVHTCCMPVPMLASSWLNLFEHAVRVGAVRGATNYANVETKKSPKPHLDGLAAGAEPCERHFGVDALCDLLELWDLHTRHIIHRGLDLRTEYGTSFQGWSISEPHAMPCPVICGDAIKTECCCDPVTVAMLSHTFTVGWSTLSKTVYRKSPAAYFASVSANAAARRFSPMAVFVSTIFFSICLYE